MQPQTTPHSRIRLAGFWSIMYSCPLTQRQWNKPDLLVHKYLAYDLALLFHFENYGHLLRWFNENTKASHSQRFKWSSFKGPGFNMIVEPLFGQKAFDSWDIYWPDRGFGTSTQGWFWKSTLPLLLITSFGPYFDATYAPVDAITLLLSMFPLVDFKYPYIQCWICHAFSWQISQNCPVDARVCRQTNLD